ncbi:MAG: hypothetical protein DI537_51500, partial [Stutzerimonas stutzeri]
MVACLIIAFPIITFLLTAYYFQPPDAQVENPATGESLARVTECRQVETYAAIDAAERAFGAWAGASSEVRSKTLREWHRLVLEAEEDLVRIMTAE